jgi:hypothetical protein
MKLLASWAPNTSSAAPRPVDRIRQQMAVCAVDTVSGGAGLMRLNQETDKTTDMAVSDPAPNLEAMQAELAELLQEEREISAARKKLHAQIDSFPGPLVVAEARKLSRQRRDLHLRIDRLRIDINLLTRR